MVGGYSDWRINQHCHTQSTPVPRASTAEYQCNEMLRGHVVSINKTSSPGPNMDVLVVPELEVFGYEPGENIYVLLDIND